MDIDGRTIAVILKQEDADADAMAAALVGCAFFVNESADFNIEAVDAATQTVTVKTGRGSPVTRNVQTGTVVASEVVAALVDSYKARLEAPLPYDVEILVKSGVTARLSRDEAAILAGVIRHEGLPEHQTRRLAIDVLKHYDLRELRIGVIQRWLSALSGPAPMDLEIQNAWCQRKLGNPEEARKALERALPEARASGSEVVQTQMAATFLDLLDESSDDHFLRLARQFHDEAFALNSESAHLAGVRLRLEAREASNGDRTRRAIAHSSCAFAQAVGAIAQLTDTKSLDGTINHRGG